MARQRRCGTDTDNMAAELARLRKFRDQVLTSLERVALGFWERELMALAHGRQREITIEDTRTRPSVRAVQDAAAAIVRAEAAIERRIPPGLGNVRVMRERPQLKARYLAAHERFEKAIRHVKEWPEVVVCDLARWAKEHTNEVAERTVIERWLLDLIPTLYGTVEERAALQQKQRGGQRRQKEQAAARREWLFQWGRHALETNITAAEVKTLAYELAKHEGKRTGDLHLRLARKVVENWETRPQVPARHA